MIGNGTTVVVAAADVANSIRGLVEAATRNMALLAVSAGTVFLVIGGFMLMAAGGNGRASESARNAMVRAVIGMVIVLAAGAIAKAIYDAVS